MSRHQIERKDEDTRAPGMSKQQIERKGGDTQAPGMSKQQIIRMIVDFAMTVILLLQMGYLRIGETVHEWLGITMFVLFIVHHLLNRRWIAEIFHGKYSPFRVFQTALVVLLFLTMIGSAVSGIMVSKHVFTFMDIGHISFARNLHMLCGYWNFVLMSLHLGLHWIMITGMISRQFAQDSRVLGSNANAGTEINTGPEANPAENGNMGSVRNAENGNTRSDTSTENWKTGQDTTAENGNTESNTKSGNSSRTAVFAARIIAALIAAYGIFVMITRQIPEYLFGTVKFASFNISEPLPLFLLDYLAMMGLFVFAGHYVAKGLRKKN